MDYPVLQLAGVTKVYTMGESQVHALKGIDMEIAEGEMVSVMGPSGCGKSTMLQIAGCLDKPTSGTVRISGTSAGDLDDKQLARIRNKHIGIIFQTFNLLPHEDALNNVNVPLQYSGMSKKEGKEASARALQAVSLGDRLHHKPNELSGGQRQRVAIARAIVNQPAIVLADEPTGALDQSSGREVMGILQRLNAQGRTIVVVTHDKDVANYSGRIVELRDGRIVGDRAVRSKVVTSAEIDAGGRAGPPAAGQKICVRCGFGNRPRAGFCANCGFPLEVAPRISDTIIRRMVGLEVDCPYCGTPNRPFARYCISCGGAMDDALKARPVGGMRP
ncbi:MAG: ATP-binding cassette domain-containing protein [Actinomycetota bacterium]|nr:ATP-binding cassette domain-containing protein [Actinomycetota bacterium]